jgi:hypothetical protein
LASSRKNNPFYTRKELKFNEKKIHDVVVERK